MRIWVTGIGVVSPLGVGAAPTMQRLLAKERAFAPLDLFSAEGARSQIAAQVPGLDLRSVGLAGAQETWSRTDAMALLAAREALAQAALVHDRDERAALDLIVGGTTAGMYETEDLLAQMHREPDKREPLSRMLSHPLSATVDQLCAALGPIRRARTLCSACSSGTNAILLAAGWLRSGRSERVLAGGADGLCRLTYTGFSCLSALSDEPCRPFDERRKGLNLGEGAAMLLLETEASARARGAVPIAELRGWAVGAEAHDITNPQASCLTAARVMQEALSQAGIEPSNVDYVNAHGTATKLNDAMEAAALRQCFGDALERIAVSSSKGQIGHTLGAAGAIEAAVTAMAVAQGELPPTAGLEQVDQACQLDHVLTRRSTSVRAAMSNSFGFGGSDAVIVMAQPGLFAPPDAADPVPVYVTAAATVGPLGVQSGANCGAYAEPGPAPGPGMIAFEAKDHLDVGRARRIDRAGRLTTVAIQSAMDPAGPAGQPSRLGHSGAVFGAAFGSIDACAAFVDRIYEKGPRFASPAVFPNLLPSSPVAHASIYRGLGGRGLACHELGASAEASMLTAIELIAAGQADRMVAGGVEELSAITERVLGPLCGAGADGPGQPHRSEGCAALLFETAAPTSAVRGSGPAPVVRVVWSASWRGRFEASGLVHALPEPTLFEHPLVALSRPSPGAAEALSPLGWSDVPRLTSAPRAGNHEAAGGFAAAAAFAQILAARHDAALVLGLGPDRTCAFLMATSSFEPPDRAP